MNTRLQVEHPVTEMVTGIDLVREQIRIAEGEPLAFQQDQITRTGHALECRICAEDPENSFMPSTGRLSEYELPEGRIRVDNGFRQGDEVSVFYDSLMAKVISWGETRQDAIASMKRALSDFTIEGVHSTIPFCLFVLRHQAFVDGNINTRFIDQYFSPAAMNRGLSDRDLAAALSAFFIATRGKANSNEQTAVNSSEGKWRNGRRDFFR
jgi:acetyl/propionyl-CoA carboxylase alpha subunit